MKLIEPDEDNSKAFAQRWACLLCEEKFSLGEMIVGSTFLSPMRCPYCKSDETYRDQNFQS